MGYNLCADPEIIDNKTLFYYTLHLTTMSSPLYTSEKICSRNPKWTKINICNSIGSAKGNILLYNINLSIIYYYMKYNKSIT